MHIPDYTQYFASMEELADFCMLEVDEQNAILATLADAGRLNAEMTCRVDTASREERKCSRECATQPMERSTNARKKCPPRRSAGLLKAAIRVKSSVRNTASWLGSAIKRHVTEQCIRHGCTSTGKEE